MNNFKELKQGKVYNKIHNRLKEGMLSQTEEKIAHAILKNPKIAMSTIRKLSNKIEVSKGLILNIY